MLKMKKYQELFLYITVFVTGAVVLILEILGTRVVAPFYGATIFVWTSLITVTMGALALGYFVGGWLADKYPRSVVLYKILFLAGLSVLLPMKIDQWVLPLTESLGLRWGPLVSTMILFFVPLGFLATTSPFIIRLLSKSVKSSGQVAGRVFGVATIGSIAGALLAGFYLTNFLSVTDAFLYTSWCLIALTLVGVYLSSKKGDFRLLVLMLIVTFGVMKIPKYVYKDKYTLKILHQEQSFYGDLKVIEIGKHRCLAVNGSLQSCRRKGGEQTSFTNILEEGRLIQARKPKNMLVLGVGAADILDVVPADLEVDLVELDPKVVDLGKKYFDIPYSQNHNLIIDDARHFIRHANKSYDLILFDLGLGNALPEYMFTREAFGWLRQALTSDGLMILNIEGQKEPKDDLIVSIFKTGRTVFPGARLTSTPNYVTILFHFPNDDDYQPDLRGSKFSELAVDDSNAAVFTDDKSVFNLMAVDKLELFIREMKNLGGNRLLFSI